MGKGHAPRNRGRVFALAAYVTVTSVLTLIDQVDVKHSTLGIVITALSVVIMPFLSLAERRAGRELGSATARHAISPPRSSDGKRSIAATTITGELGQPCQLRSAEQSLGVVE
ncbi:hypothetical protein MTsN4n12_09250 [Microbacterium sp. MTN4-12]